MSISSSRPRSVLRLVALGAAAIGIGALLLAGPAAAQAHDALESSSPAAGDSVTTDPGTVSLTFSDALITIGDDTSGFAVQVVDSEGLHYESGCVSIEGTSVAAPVALGLAGGYVVLWQVVSSDGHPTSGQYDFDYEPASQDGAHDGLTDPPVCGEAWSGEPDGGPTATATPPATAGSPAATATAAPAPLATAAAESAPATDAPNEPAPALPWPVVVLIALAGLGVIAAIVVLVLRRNQGGTGAE